MKTQKQTNTNGLFCFLFRVFSISTPECSPPGSVMMEPGQTTLIFLLKCSFATLLGQNHFKTNVSYIDNFLFSPSFTHKKTLRVFNL